MLVLAAPGSNRCVRKNVPSNSHHSLLLTMLDTRLGPCHPRCMLKLWMICKRKCIARLWMLRKRRYIVKLWMLYVNVGACSGSGCYL